MTAIECDQPAKTLRRSCCRECTIRHASDSNVCPALANSGGGEHGDSIETQLARERPGRHPVNPKRGPNGPNGDLCAYETNNTACRQLPGSNQGAKARGHGPEIQQHPHTTLDVAPVSDSG